MTLRNRAFRNLGGVVALCALAAACSHPPPPAPSPQPSPSTTTPAETQLERQTRLDFEAAEKAYRSFRAEYDRLAAAGGTDRATPEMSETAAGPYLEVMTRFLAQTKAAGKRQQGSVRIAYVRYASYSPEELRLDVCEDGRKVRNVAKDGHVSAGVAAKVTLYVRPIKGRWKVWNGDDLRVASCAA